ncbi:uncharacterized protein LOC121377055 [Gigantopelta aegis]|uniref:uncharacterized protein LOC121377055 n=1 Tax=Gigantopelta aegis TaxID=1735272 RepID=UPI001B88AA82|nr:uncharacterized protein LOC121377055 [Gigantopelta aegis]
MEEQTVRAGFSAKYGSYSLIDLSKDKVIILELIQSNEVGGSHYMEKQGLDQALTSLMEHGISVDVLVTDRHCQIKKWMREQHADIAHYFDVWHVAKGIKKKLIALAKEKDCSTLRPWIKSISNHVHWTAASTPDGNGDVMVSKWYSLLHHISNIHSGHDGPFTECEHGPLEGEDRDNLWLKPGTKVFSMLENIVEKNILLKDIRKLSPVHQTSSIESFHNVINHFAPKMFPFSYMGLLCRITLAALHFNENARRAQAKTALGNLRYKLQFPRYAPGECRAKPIKVERSYNYVEEIMTLVNQTASHINLTSQRPAIDTPPPLTAAYEKPLKDDVVKAHKKRFAKK